MISPLEEHWKITKDALEKYGYSGLGMLSFASLCESIKASQHSVHPTALGGALIGFILGSGITALYFIFTVIGGR